MGYNVENGFHKGTLFSCMFLAFCWSMLAAVILPNTPFLIQYYLPTVDPTEIGTLTGIFTAANFTGIVFGSIIWGFIADKIGRKSSVIISLLLNVVCIILLAFSKQYWYSVAIRFFNGLIDGTVTLAQTILAEISNSRNIALGTSFFFVGTAIGGLVGPILFGYLSNTSNIAGLIKTFPIFGEKPFLLPLLIISSLFLLCGCSFLFFSIETLTDEDRQKTKEKRDKLRASYRGTHGKTEEEMDLEEKLLHSHFHQESPTNIFKQYDFVHIMITFALFSLIQMGYDTLFPVVLAAKRSIGGLELSSVEIGCIVGISSIFQLVMVIICPLLSRIMSYKTQFTVYAFLFMIGVLITPFILMSIQLSKPAFYAILLIDAIIMGLLRALTIGQSIILFANISYKEVRATVMGISHTVTGFCRVLGPLIFPPIYSWSCKQHSWLINSNFSFIVIGICGLLSVCFMIGVSNSTDKPKGSIYDEV